MILRRITEHVRARTWFIAGLDFRIAVFGVFVAAQVSNWNAARADNNRAAERRSRPSSARKTSMAPGR